MTGFINYKKVLIVGLGMIGGSYAQKLSSLGFEVGALARRQETLDYALEKGYIAHGRLEVTRDYVSQFDLVVSALYPKAFLVPTAGSSPSPTSSSPPRNATPRRGSN